MKKIGILMIVMFSIQLSLVSYAENNTTTPQKLKSEIPLKDAIVIRVDGLSCPFCAYGLEKKLKAIKGVKTIKISIKKGMAFVIPKKNAKISDKDFLKAVKEAGFTLKEIKRPKQKKQKASPKES